MALTDVITERNMVGTKQLIRTVITIIRPLGKVLFIVSTQCAQCYRRSSVIAIAENGQET